MKELNNLIHILEELKEDYFEGALTDQDFIAVMLENLDDLTGQLIVYRNLKERLRLK